MTTLWQAISRAREDGQIPTSGDVLVSNLQIEFQPPDRGSMRSLITAMMARAAVSRPYAVILCRFKGDSPHPDERKLEAFFREAFTRGTGGLVEFWQDVSLGKVDVSGTQVFGWTEVDLTREAAGPPTKRGDLTEAAIRAIQAEKDPITGNNKDPLTNFYNQISIYMYGQTAEGRPIDGSTDGNGRTNLGPPLNGDVTAHEMGHSLGMQHDADVTGNTLYHDPSCIMSQNGTFTLQPWGVSFGPALCLPHLLLQGWMYTHRMLFDAGAWAADPNGITFQLAPNSEPASPVFLGASLSVPGSSPEWAYLLEVVTATGWNQGVPGMPYVMVRRVSSQTDLQPKSTCMYLHAIQFTATGAPVVYHDPSGQTSFTVAFTSSRGPIVTVHAKRD